MAFGEMCGDGLFKDGDWIESKDQDPNGDVRIIQLADIGVGQFIDKSSRFMTLEKTRELNCTYLQEGDILIARMPDPIGRACILPAMPQVCVTAVDVCIVRLDSEEIDSRWLMHKINSNGFNHQILQFVTGTTRKRISRGNLSKLMIDIPPTDEQKRVAAILDKADEIKQTTDKSDELKVEMIRSTYLEMFGDPALNPNNWQKEKLGDISNSILGKMLSPDARNMQPQYSYLANRNVRWRTFSLEDLESMHFNDKELQKYSLETGDVLICEGGEVGRCAVWRDEISNCYFQKALHRLRCNHDYLEPEFFVETMMLLSSQGALFASTSTATFSHLTGVRLKQLMIPIPPIDLQKKFVRILEQISAIPSSSEISIQNTSSIVQQLLN
jgi:type I restriction enzyme, S subunit